jgi:hypothetical protein
MSRLKTKVYILDLGKMEVDMNLLIANYVLGLKSNPTPNIVSKIPPKIIGIEHHNYE